MNPDELLITDQPIAGAEAAPWPAGGASGAVVVFWGVVRDLEAGAKIAALDYTAFRPMAEHQFRKILAEARERWPLQRVRVVHRLGVVAVGEASLLVRVESAHRAEAFAAAQFVINELKQRLPIWKEAVM
ncbi:MAG: molybdenum cofactor biosynthesis protein MoaE [Verrucomicrobia bacterium]|nr:molybdenum cofactor biosynthesis protein MoaE [Verrucomicrobiota bacterium]